MEEEATSVHSANRSIGRRLCDGCLLTLTQFFLLLWKNFILQIRRPIGTIFEIFVPLAAVIVIVGFRLGLFQAEDRCFVTFQSDPLVIPFGEPYKIYYAPNTTEANQLASLISLRLISSGGMLVGVPTQEDFISAIHSDQDDNRTIGCFLGGVGIYFENLTTDDVRYTFRFRQDPAASETWYTNNIAPLFQPQGARIKPNFYLNEGFLHLQKIVDEAIIQWKTNQPINIGVDVRQFPYPKYRRDTFLEIIDFILPLFIIISFIYSAGVFVKELVLEKESRIRETMKMMGLSNWILQSTWFIKQLIFYLIPIIIMTIILRVGMVFPRSNPVLVFVYLFMYAISGIAFCFFISVWFSTARIGLMAGFICWFIAYFPYLFISSAYEATPFGVKVAVCLIPNTCVGFGVTVLSVLELRQEGLNFNNFATPLSLDDQLHMGWIVIMLAVDTFIYMMLYWYIDAIKPGQYGVPKPFYFIFLPSYWCGYRRNSNKGKKVEENLLTDPTAFEKDPINIPVGIDIDSLTKIYNKRNSKRRKVAVDCLSLKLYKGQITALLGHNGAGKTTTLSILTGLFPPTSGSAHINGLSVVDDIDLIRRNLGICPQHNVLFDRLTVAEHLNFFARLKGATGGKKLKAEIKALIDDLLLSDKKRVQSQKLSGGMKRKLSVGIALVGGSEIVILDEPTSGMDPYARRATWDLLVKYKEGRTIMLTTHFMDEADLLGDRIAIMAEGRLKCCGSSLFLKSRYGVGYHMTMVKEPTCDSTAVMSMVLSMVNGAERVTDVGAELSFILPSQSTHQFSHLFDVLDDQKRELGISSFGISVTTMEEVFIRVASGTDSTLFQESIQSKMIENPSVEIKFAATVDGNEETQTAQIIFVNKDAEYPTPAVTPATAVVHPNCPPALKIPDHVPNNTDDGDDAPISPRHDASSYGTFNARDSLKLNVGITLWCQQFVAIFLKRFYNSLRFWVAIIWQLIIPLIFVLWGLILGVTNTGLNSDDPSRSLTIQNSAPSDNITFFWAQFGYADSNLFSSDNAELLGITDFLDYTPDILSIVNSVQNYTNASQCCNYRNQFLDKFCASVTLSQLEQNGVVCPNNADFGYRHCSARCLSCCNATRSTLNTCTNPFQQDVSTSLRGRIASDNFCPVPPSVSIDDHYNGLPSGALDNMNVYVAEKLLSVSAELDVIDFNLRIQGGYVIHSPEPTYSICGCNNTELSCDILARTLTNNSLNFANLLRILENNLPSSSSFNNTFRNTFTNSICNNLPVVPPESCAGLDSSEWNYNYNYFTETCTDSCNGTGSCAGMCTIGGSTSCTTAECNCRIGQTSQPPPAATTPAVTIWYNNQPYHIVSAALNGFYNLYLNRTLNSSVKITITNYPLPRNLETQVTDAQQEFLGFSISSTSVFGLSFLFASFVIFLVKERDTKAKHLQFVSGVQASSYWLATFVWDLLNAFIPAILTVILFAAFQIEGYRDENIAAVFLLVILGCWASIPVNYIASFLFSNALVAFCIMLVFFYFGSLIFQVIVFLLRSDNPDLSDTLNYIFLLHPAYALTIGLANMYTNQGIRNTCEQSDIARRLCEQNDIKYADSAFEFSTPGIGHIFLYMAVEGIVFLVLTIIIERKLFVPEMKRLLTSRKISAASGNEFVVEFPEEDNDVLDEKRKVASMTSYSENNAVVIKSLAKEYKGIASTLCPFVSKFKDDNKLAVNYVSLIVPAGECFGLLGVNGAGKTTTFKMLTGDITPTGGTAILSGYDINTQLRLVQQRIGYCPQFDALIERLTGRELLTMFARLRGIPEKAIKVAVQTEIERLDLVKYANKRCGTYSGGNKRKLSTAVTLVGNPPILLLDEPTTGMDPATRRFLWDVLTGVIREGRSIILTSHSMEECEALCTRLAIMVNGNFKCLGSIQHLKSKFGSGYTLQMKIQPQDPEKLTEQSSSRRSLRRNRSNRHSNRSIQSPRPMSPRDDPFDTSYVEYFINDTFPGSVLLEHHQGSITYQIPAEGVTWSSLFKTVEENKENLRIIDYSVSQTTLDQVFITFAQEQEESD